MALHAHPHPLDPYNPAGSQHEQLRHPSPFVPIRIPVFTPVVWLNDLIIRVISLLGTFGGASKGFSNDMNARRMRALSDSVDSVEEGDAVELRAYGMNVTPSGSISSTPAPGPRVVSTRIRVSRGGAGNGSRRKFD